MNEQVFISKVVPLSNKLLRISLGILGKGEEARDAVQEVIIKLWNDREKLESYRSIEAYARTVTRNHCLDVLRLKKKEVEFGNLSIAVSNENEEDNEIRVSEKLGMVRAAFAQLNELQQQVFTMRDIEGMEFDEISQSLGITQENARVILSRARGNIRQIVADEQKRKWR